MRSYGESSARDAYNQKRLATYLKVAADGAASTTTAETLFFSAKQALTIESVEYLPSAALTAHDTTNATLTLRRRNADGTSAASVAALTTNLASGNWTQWVAKSLGTITNGSLSAGQILTLEIAKGSTGVVVPAGVLQVTYTVD